MHFPRPEVRIYPRKQKPTNQTEKQENGAEAQTQTTTQQLPPVGEETLVVPSLQKQKAPALCIASVQTEVSTLGAERANHHSGRARS